MPAPPKVWIVTVKGKPPGTTRPFGKLTSFPSVTYKLTAPVVGFRDQLVISPKMFPGYPGVSPIWSTQSKCPRAEPSEKSVASNPNVLTPIPSSIMAIPPPLILPTTVAALAATGCDASIATASEIAAMSFTSFCMMSLFHLPVSAPKCRALACGRAFGSLVGLVNRSEELFLSLARRDKAAELTIASDSAPQPSDPGALAEEMSLSIELAELMFATQGGSLKVLRNPITRRLRMTATLPLA